MRERTGQRCPAGRAGGTTIGLGRSRAGWGRPWRGAADEASAGKVQRDWRVARRPPRARHTHFIHPIATRPTAQVRLRCGDPQAPGSGPWGWGARPASTHPGCPTLAVWLSFLEVQGPLGICDSHGHRALHTGHGALPSAGWGGAWAGSTDAHDPWAWSQVSHHPPSAAHYVFSRHGWSLWQEITIASKFRGKYLSIMPLGEQGQKTCWGRGRVGRAWGLRG